MCFKGGCVPLSNNDDKHADTAAKISFFFFVNIYSPTLIFFAGRLVGISDQDHVISSSYAICVFVREDVKRKWHVINDLSCAMIPSPVSISV